MVLNILIKALNRQLQSLVIAFILSILNSLISNNQSSTFVAYENRDWT